MGFTEWVGVVGGGGAYGRMLNCGKDELDVRKKECWVLRINLKRKGGEEGEKTARQEVFFGGKENN